MSYAICKSIYFFSFTLFNLSHLVFIYLMDFKPASHLDAPLRYYLWVLLGFFCGFILFIPRLTLLSSLHFSMLKSCYYTPPHLSAPPTKEFNYCWVWETFFDGWKYWCFLAYFSFFPADMAILGMDIEVQTVEDNVISLEMLFKTWLHDHGTDREQLHLLLPSGSFGHAAAPKNTLSISFSLPSAPLQGAPESLSLKGSPGLSWGHLPSHLETQVRSVGNLENHQA